MDIALPACLPACFNFITKHTQRIRRHVCSRILCSPYGLSLLRKNVISCAEIVVKYPIIPVIDKGTISRICP